MSESIAKDNYGRYACLLFDSTLKTVLGNAEHEDLFIEMLEFLIPGKHITSVTMLNREYNGLVNSEKKVTFDLLCRDEDSGEEFLVEMQNAYSRSYCDRVLYYSYYPLREQLAKKEKELISDEKKRAKMDYSLDPVYVISLVNFILDHESEEALEEGYVSRYSIRNDRNGEVLTRALNFVFAEIGRLPYGKDEWSKCRSRIERFLFTVKYMHTFAEFPVAFLNDPLLKKMADAAELANMPIELLNQYEVNMRSELDRITEINSARDLGHEAGFAEGMEKGIEKERINNARNMLADGVPVEQVAKWTGLTADEIKRL